MGMTVELSVFSEAWGNFCYDLSWSRFRRGIRDRDDWTETENLYNQELEKFRGRVTVGEGDDYWHIHFDDEADKFLFELYWVGKENVDHN